MEILVNESREKTKPIQSQTKPIAGLRPETRSTKLEIRNNFAKQSHFLKTQNDAIPV
jgi:hypothetical protein